MPPKSNNDKVISSRNALMRFRKVIQNFLSEEGGRGRRSRQADQATGKRRQVSQAEEGGAEDQEGCRQGEEVRLVDLSPSISIKIM